MFGPLAERAWAGPQWDPRVLWAPGEGDCEGMVFRNGDGGPVWIAIRFDAVARVAEYVHFLEPVVTRIRVEVMAAGEDESRVEVGYSWIATSEEGNAIVEERRAAAEVSLPGWQPKIAAALKAAGA